MQVPAHTTCICMCMREHVCERQIVMKRVWLLPGGCHSTETQRHTNAQLDSCCRSWNVSAHISTHTHTRTLARWIWAFDSVACAKSHTHTNTQTLTYTALAGSIGIVLKGLQPICCLCVTCALATAVPVPIAVVEIVAAIVVIVVMHALIYSCSLHVAV